MSTVKIILSGMPILFIVLGCATSRPQPIFEEATIENQQLTLRETTLITVKVNDPYDIVKQVEGVVMEDTSALAFHFNDDGKLGDELAGDTVWSIRVKVPYDGWAGTFTFKITAYNDKREAIIVRDALNEVAPMTTTLNLDVHVSDKKEEEAP